ncbi:MAG: DnaJ family domain-containing protein [Anaerolineales bacterium]
MMDRKARGIEEIIQQAMREGAFDNLPGKGQPLKLDENPFLDPEWQLAYHLLKQNGFAPDFIEQRQSIELELAAAREALARSWAWRQKALAAGERADWVEAEWGKAKKEFDEKVAEMNKKIKNYNLAIPTPTLYRKPVDLEQELIILAANIK